MAIKKVFILVLLQVISASCFASVSWADVVVIAHPQQKEKLTEQNVRSLYVGSLKMRKIELVEQSEGQQVRAEFYAKFLQKTENQMKQIRSVLVFSGERIPATLQDDNAIYEYIKSHSNAIGYVTSEFFDKKKNVDHSDTTPVSLFAVSTLNKQN